MRATHIAIIVALVMLAIVAWLSPAKAHDWYPLSCCSKKDCFALDQSEVAIERGGYRIKATNELVPFNRARQTPSEGGGSYHRCSVGGGPNGKTINMTPYQGADEAGIPQTPTPACFWAPFTGS